MNHDDLRPLACPSVEMELQVFLIFLPNNRFKTACRALGLSNWPYRRRKSVHTLLENIADEGNADEVMEILKAEDAALLREPTKGLCLNFKRLRQAFYKEKYKERKASN